jgi:hypothetical protein
LPPLAYTALNLKHRRRTVADPLPRPGVRSLCPYNFEVLSTTGLHDDASNAFLRQLHKTSPGGNASLYLILKLLEERDEVTRTGCSLIPPRPARPACATDRATPPRRGLLILDLTAIQPQVSPPLP